MDQQPTTAGAAIETYEEPADDDFVRLVGASAEVGQVDLRLKKGGIDQWPPPPYLTIKGHLFTRISYSSLTREQTDACPNVARGALYHQVTDKDHIAAIAAYMTNPPPPAPVQ